MILHSSAELKRAKALLGRVDRERNELLGSATTLRGREKPITQGAAGLVSLFGEEKLLYAGLSPAERESLGKEISIILLVTVIAVLVSQQIVPVVFFPLYLLWRSAVLGLKASKRTESFDKDYAALLLSLSSGVKTGLDPLIALVRSGELFQPESVMRGELKELSEALNSGASEEEAVRRFGRSVRHPDLRLFHLAFILARREGSSLSECLRRLAKVTRQRQSFRRKIRSAVAMQKLSAFGIGGCAFIIGCIQFLGNPEAIQAALGHPMGIKLMFVGVLLIFAGIGWMLRMSTSSVEER